MPTMHCEYAELTREIPITFDCTKLKLSGLIMRDRRTKCQSCIYRKESTEGGGDE